MSGSGQVPNPRIPVTPKKSRCPFDPNHEVPEGEFSAHVERCQVESGTQVNRNLLVCHYNFTYSSSVDSTGQPNPYGTAPASRGASCQIVLPWSATGPPCQILLPWSTSVPRATPGSSLGIGAARNNLAGPGADGINTTGSGAAGINMAGPGAAGINMAGPGIAANQTLYPRLADELDLMEAGVGRLNLTDEDMEFDANF